MQRRLMLSLALACMVSLALSVSAFAGGWAIVTVDHLPRDVQAGAQMSLGFMVRQHGITPTDDVTPSLFATHQATGEILRVNARQDGAKGHFVLDVTFPRAGEWAWEIIPAPFAGTKLEPLTVASAVSATQPVASSVPSVEANTLRSGLRWLGLFAVLAAAALAVTRPCAVSLSR